MAALNSIGGNDKMMKRFKILYWTIYTIQSFDLSFKSFHWVVFPGSVQWHARSNGNSHWLTIRKTQSAHRADGLLWPNGDPGRPGGRCRPWGSGGVHRVCVCGPVCNTTFRSRAFRWGFKHFRWALSFLYPVQRKVLRNSLIRIFCYPVGLNCDHVGP